MELTNIHSIVLPVRNARAKSTSTEFRRHAPKLEYAKANQRWWIHLRFSSDIDLYILEKAVMGSEIRLVELKDNFYLEDPRIPDSADMGEAYRLAESVVAQLDGATRLLCAHFQGVQIECIVELFENGSGRSIVGFDLRVHGTSDFPEIESFLNGEQAPIGAILPVWKSNKDVQDALYYLGNKGNVWANLYKVCEIVQDLVAGNKMFQNGWCSRSEWERFTRTANHQEAIGTFSRHARSRVVPPQDPMTVAEARSFAGALVKGWIQSLTGGDASQERSVEE